MAGRVRSVALGLLTLVAARGEIPARGESTTARWRPLRSPAASASSFLQNDWNRYQENYHPSYVLDENPGTAWVEGVEGQGEKESITLPLSALGSARVLRLRIWNGYQKSKELWTRNAMPRRIEVSVLDAAGTAVTSRQEELGRVWGPQEVMVPIPPRRGFSAVRLTILSVHPGTRYKDTCLSDILIDVDSEVPHNAVAEAAKQAALRRWVDERKESAAYFASRPREFPFAFTKYAQKQSWFAVEEFKRHFADRAALAAKVGGPRYKPVVKRPIPSGPDGFYNVYLYVEDFLQLFKIDQVSLFETGEELASHKPVYEGLGDLWTTTVRTGRSGGRSAGVVTAMQFGVRQVITERTTSTSTRDVLLAYDEGGRLQRVYRERRETSNDPGDNELSELQEIFQFSYDAAGKIAAIEHLSHGRSAPDRARKLREDRKATRVLYSGVPEKGS